MSTTTASRTAGRRSEQARTAEVAAGRAYLRLVPPAGDTDGAAGPVADAGEARARAAHPAGRARRAGAVAVPPVAAPLHLTRRGRLLLRVLVVVLMLAVMSAAATALARGARASDGPAPAVAVATHVVLPGETLWGIAQQVAPHDDPRDTVSRIVEFNALTSAAVQAGQRLALPPGLPAR